MQEGRTTPGKPTKHNYGPFKFTYTQLEKEGVILESKSFADRKYVYLLHFSIFSVKLAFLFVNRFLIDCDVVRNYFHVKILMLKFARAVSVDGVLAWNFFVASASSSERDYAELS